MEETSEVIQVCSSNNCNYDATRFSEGMFWCRYCWWAADPAGASACIKYLDVIA